MSQVIRISENLYERLEKHVQGFDTPANVIEKVLNYYEKHRGEAVKTEWVNPEPPNETPTSLDIIYQPDGEDAFKKALLEKKRAYIRTYKLDGTSELKRWNAARFSPDSSVNANLRSGYLRGWRDKGIYKAVITVSEPDAASQPTSQHVELGQSPSGTVSSSEEGKCRMDDRVHTRNHNAEVLYDLGFYKVSNTTVFRKDNNYILSPAVAENTNGKYWFDVRKVNLDRINESAWILVRIVPDLFILESLRTLSSLFSAPVMDNRKNSGNVWGIHIDINKASRKAFLFNIKNPDNRISTKLLEKEDVHNVVGRFFE